jgi:hypothetical protein
LAKNSNFTQKWPTKDLKIINYLCFSLFWKYSTQCENLSQKTL